MYLKVSLPLTYVVSNSPSDSTTHNIFPFGERLTSHPHHRLFLSLKSYQLPWRQFNKKGEIYEYDDVHTFYPAFRTTSKIRPKMMPSSGQMTLFSKSNLGSLVKLGPNTTTGKSILPSSAKGEYRKWNSPDNETAENKYASDLTMLSSDFYDKIYKKFISTRLLPVHSFIKWVGKQKDIVGFQNEKVISPEKLKEYANVNYLYARVDSNGDVISKPHLRSQRMNEEQVAGDINLKVKQTCFASVPYEKHPADFGFLPVPVPSNFTYKSDLEEQGDKMLHKDVSWRAKNNRFINAPVLDWQQAGFPDVAQTSVKALYHRKPIHQQFAYSKIGFVKESLVKNGEFLESLFAQSRKVQDWFSDISLPIDAGANVISKYGRIYGSVRVVSAMSENNIEYYRQQINPQSGDIQDQKLGSAKAVESLGKAYQFTLERSFGSQNAQSRLHFPRGDLPEGIVAEGLKLGLAASDLKWDNFEYLPLYEKGGSNMYGYYRQPLRPAKDWAWSNPATQKSVIHHPITGVKQGMSVSSGPSSLFQSIMNYNLHNTPQNVASQKLQPIVTTLKSMPSSSLSDLKLSESVIYPRFIYSSETITYESFPNQDRGKYEMRWVESCPTSDMKELESDGMEIIRDFLDKGLLPNTLSFHPNGSPQTSATKYENFSRIYLLLSYITRLEDYPFSDFSVSSIPVKSGKAVKITQDLTLNFDLETFNTLKARSGASAGFIESNFSSREIETLENYLEALEFSGYKDKKVEYSIVIYIAPDDLSVSIISYSPSILMHNTAQGRAGQRLKPFIQNYDLMQIFTNPDSKSIVDFLFKSQSRPYLIHEVERYTDNNDAYDVILLKDDNLGERPEDVKGWSAKNYLPSFNEDTVFNDYCFSALHIKSGMTVSDPLNTTPLDIKRNKISVKRPFQYTSVFPVLGDKVHFPLAKESVEYRDENYERKTIFVNYSPVALYTIDTTSETYPTNVPEKVFKLLNTNARTFKGQRQPQIDGRKAKDYADFDSIILPFENITEDLVKLPEIMPYQTKSLEKFAQTMAEDYQMPYLKSATQDARSEGKGRKYLSQNMANWSLGVPAEFVPETYSLTGMELGLFNWPLGLV
jgi:hypothetical protein